ncbi:MAG: RNA pseudouridine synthase, partial [Glaciecola sp.]
ASEAFMQALRNFKRQALHAAQLSFAHPITEDWLTFNAPLPDDFVQLLEDVRADTDIHGIAED